MITKLQAKGLDRSAVRLPIQEVMLERSHLHLLHIRKINREQNKAAHELEHLAVRSSPSLFFSPLIFLSLLMLSFVITKYHVCYSFFEKSTILMFA
jgi:hypothetical protein